MSSQAVATATRGLLDLTSWPDHDTFDDSDSDHDSGSADELDLQPIFIQATQRDPWTLMDDQQRNQAVGNLLAALAPINNQTQTQTQTQPAPVATPISRALSPPPIEPLSDSPIETESVAPSAQVDAGETALAVNNLLPLDIQIPLSDAPTLLPDYTIPFDPLDPPPISPLEYDPGVMTAYNDGPPPPITSPISHAERRQVEAFAKLEFDDGNYYLTTYACELGRDALAYQAAIAKAIQVQAERESGAHSSSGKRSAHSQRVAPPAGSQIQGSVVSEAGGFGGVDERPMVDGHPDESGLHPHSQSSGRSTESHVRPQEVLYNPPLAPFDYHKEADRQANLERRNGSRIDDEIPAPVTDEHLPDAHRCPLIPIHATQTTLISEVEGHKAISRRHIRIEWSDDDECFVMRVLGRNGAFLNNILYKKGFTRKLRDGSKIQVANVEVTFRLPRTATGDSGSDESAEDELDQSPLPQRSTSQTSDEQDEIISPPRPGKGKTKIILKTSEPARAMASVSEPQIGLDGLPLPPKRRGPGRPPKDGIMSTRERKEREKAAKMAELKAVNGGMTPPPQTRPGKAPRTFQEEEEALAEQKNNEKRKYKKRKREGEDGEIMQSIEGGDIEVPVEPEKPPPKKARSKSPSPDYPPIESFTEEQLLRPNEPYARLIYDILDDIHPKALPLKQIYRALKLKFPFFVHKVESEGWQSSVRHNLNQEWNKLFDKGEKEGKGFAWKSIPGALQPQTEKRRTTQQASTARPRPPAAPRQNLPHGPAQNINWQNHVPYPPQGPAGYNPGPNGAPWAGAQQPPVPAFQSGQGGRLPAHMPTQGAPLYNGVPLHANMAAARNMPCTLDGVVAIRAFEMNMLGSLPADKVPSYKSIFSSAKDRLLHGKGNLPEDTEASSIVLHMQNVIRYFANPNFAGFGATTISATPAPASQNVPPPNMPKTQMVPTPPPSAPSQHATQSQPPHIPPPSNVQVPATGSQQTAPISV